MADESKRTYQILVFGATGFTGTLVAEYLAENAPEGLRWGIAGRNEAKLRKIFEDLQARGCKVPPSGMVRASSDDPQALKAMAEQTDVVLTTVGPYVQYGEPLVKACVEAGTHCADITGEPRFVDRMRARYHLSAKEKGVKIINCCGFDSIPHDAGAYFTAQLLRPKGPMEIRGYVSSKGTFSGGTWHSALGAFSTFREAQAEKRSLNFSDNRPTGGRKVGATDNGISYVNEVDAWACPLPTIDPEIVRRSAKVYELFGPEFRYGHYARVKALPTLLGGVFGVAMLFSLAQFPPALALLRKVKDPGDGPSAEQRARSRFSVKFVGKADVRTVVTEVSGGDPGYSETSKMLAETGLALVFEDGVSEHAGVVTPMVAVGEPLIDRLRKAGMGFEVLKE